MLSVTGREFNTAVCGWLTNKPPQEPAQSNTHMTGSVPVLVLVPESHCLPSRQSHHRLQAKGCQRSDGQQVAEKAAKQKDTVAGRQERHTFSIKKQKVIECNNTGQPAVWRAHCCKLTVHGCACT